MLESMVNNNRPTRAEVSDITNAIMDGSDCVMLSGETASGNYPIESVKAMNNVCKVTYDKLIENSKINRLDPIEGIARCAVLTATNINSPLIIVLSESGTTARLVSKYNPKMPVIVITNNEKTAKQILLNHGLFPYLTNSMRGTIDLINQCIKNCLENNLCVKGDLIVIIYGSIECRSGSTNLLRIMTV